MSTAKKGDQPKKRDYAAERERTKLNKQKAQGGTDAQPKAETPRNGTEKPKAVEIIDDGQCGHVRVPLSQIVSDPNQPRKFFDMPSLMELSRTIIKHGVIEPILVRPIPGNLFMIVFGERRFRGSMMAYEAGNDITDIPAMIKEMTDDEALELQLIENIHRSNPHPIEDAFTFKKMLEKETVEDIAMKIDKSTKFVAMRIALTNLSQNFQDLFFANKMLIGQAVKLCKVAIKAQEAIFSDEVPDNWKDDTEFMLGDISRLVNQQTCNLDNATFKTEDAELYPEMGVCGACKFNSNSGMNLFIDQDASRICGNAVCYNIKTVRAYKATIEEVMTDPTVVFVAANHYTEDDKQKVKDVQAAGAKVLDSGSWRKVQEVQKPDWIAYLSENESNFDIEEQTREEFEAQVREEFHQELTEWEKSHNEIAAARADGKIKKAFIVAGNDAGKFTEVIAITPQAELLMGTNEGGDTGSNAIELQVSEILKREERKKELDAEDVWKQTRDIFLKDGGVNFLSTENLKKEEKSALAGAIFNCIGYNSQKEFTKDILLLNSDTELNVSEAMETLPDGAFYMLCRYLIKEKMFPAVGSHLNTYTNNLGKKVAETYYPEQIKNVEAEQAIKAEKRAQKVAAKIEELREPAQP